MSAETAGACPVRVVTIYATPWRFVGRLAADEGKPTNLRSLEKHYDLYKEQLPRLLPDRLVGRELRCGPVTVPEYVAEPDAPPPLAQASAVKITETKAELFALPSSQVALAVTMCLANAELANDHLVDAVGIVLEQCIIGNIRIGEDTIETSVSRILDAATAKGFFSRDKRGDALLPERHQLVFVARTSQMPTPPDQDTVDKILYRSTPPYRPEFVDPRLPKQLNTNGGAPPAARPELPDQPDWADLRRLLPFRRPPGPAESSEPGAETHEPTLGVVTPYVSLLFGQRPYVEASILLSTVHAVGTVARFRHIWREAYEQVLRFRDQKQKADAGQQTRDDLELLADNLGNLEFDLTFGVEFPLMRVESFQTDLWEAMDLKNQADALSRMFQQLGGSLRSELTAIEVRETRRADRRQRWNSVAAGLLSLIGVPVGFVIAFLGINTTEVPDAKVSMWNPHFATLYLIASAFAFFPGVLIALPYVQEMLLSRQGGRAPWIGSGITVAGAVILTWALVSDGHTSGFGRIVDALMTSFGGALSLLGVSVLGLWAWHALVTRREQRRQRRLGGPVGSN